MAFVLHQGFALELRMAPGNWTAVVRARDGLGQEELRTKMVSIPRLPP